MTFNPLTSFLQGSQGRNQLDAQSQQNQVRELQTLLSGQAGQAGFNPAQSPELQQLAALDPSSAGNMLSVFQNLDKSRQKAFFQDAREGKRLLQSGDGEGFLNLASNRLNDVQRLGGDPSDVMSILQSFNSGDIQGTINQLAQTEQLGIEGGFLSDPLDRAIKKASADKKTLGSASQREFASDIAGLTPEQQKEALLIKLGLFPRAVGSAIQTINDRNLGEEIGNVKATIRQREKFGELTASRRSKVIDSGFNKIEKINMGLNNIDRALSALNSGAGVGAIQKFLPSFKAASVELDNIRASMALDVVGATTFGALSAGELDLAKDVALPTGLDTPQLIDYLTRRKSAQEKLRGYFNEQIQFLDQGGTVAGFLRKKERDLDSGVTPGGSAQGLTPEEQAELDQLESEFGGL